jgi:acetoacetate decarboxylase
MIYSEPYSTPLDAPLVPRFPVAYRDVTTLTACYRTDPAAIAELVPAPLEAVGDVVMVHVYDMPDVAHFGAVRECNVMVGVQLAAADVAGGYTTALFNDSDGALALGREVHGQPKKLARPRLEVRGDLVVATLERNGIDVVTITAPYKQQPAELDGLARHFPFAENLNFKAIPHIDGTPAIEQLTARRLADLRVHECHRSACTVELRPNVLAPVWRLPVLEPLEAWLWRADFTLVAGRIVHDYLEVDA